MSFLIDLVGGAIKAVGAARMARNAAGLDTPVLDELHDGLSGARTHARVERVHDLAANAGAGQAAQPKLRSRHNQQPDHPMAGHKRCPSNRTGGGAANVKGSSSAAVRRNRVVQAEGRMPTPHRATAATTACRTKRRKPTGTPKQREQNGMLHLALEGTRHPPSPNGRWR